jgi:D-aminoacyl-tRNA deacylase
MRLVIQRVKRCSVKVGNATVGSINAGLLVLVGLQSTDAFETSCKSVLDRLLKLKLFSDPSNLDLKWKRGLNEDSLLELILVSQFTLMARTNKGAKPDFHEAMGGESARELFNRIVDYCRGELSESRVSKGAFGEYVEIDPILDGPVTITLE